eukprot:CAMPEP_0117055214 /NCGR_PEP_ID=MMETSP0472-20121206/38272_1 /TAXON_ID=693140 ORGANISM="Tiarina fusus, Strain LIS" /NCGR_SAMPLE_ID=MMETSP0472 /ASSEMBLY_ACC=CAM_ASM_000603 /LENGTH=192 /DNA_ID=CAMNT_0004771115 /DNA_START=8 /DNA_END=586 /DNA_ORIENTATION=-
MGFSQCAGVFGAGGGGGGMMGQLATTVAVGLHEDVYDLGADMAAKPSEPELTATATAIDATSRATAQVVYPTMPPPQPNPPAPAHPWGMPPPEQSLPPPQRLPPQLPPLAADNGLVDAWPTPVEKLHVGSAPQAHTPLVDSWPQHQSGLTTPADPDAWPAPVPKATPASVTSLRMPEADMQRMLLSAKTPNF